MLQRRRSNSWQAEVRERRAEVSKYLRDPAYKKQVCAGVTHLLCVSNNSWCVITRVTVTRAANWWHDDNQAWVWKALPWLRS